MMKTRILLECILLSFGVCGIPLHASVIRIPEDYPTIYQGVIAAANGDTVVIAPGTYTGTGNTAIDLIGKQIVVTSEQGPGSCIIDGEDTNRGLYMGSTETNDTVVAGITIRNCYSSNRGGGILCLNNSSPTIENCIFLSNSANFGAGLYIEGSAAVQIRDCWFEGNSAWVGGGLYVRSTNGVIDNCTIVNNSAYKGGGIGFDHLDTTTLSNCSISENEAAFGGGFWLHDAATLIIDSVIAGNSARIDGGGFYCTSMTIASIFRCTIVQNQAFLNGGGLYTLSSGILIGNFPERANFFQDNSAGSGADLAALPLTAPVFAAHNTFSGYCYSDYYVAPQQCFILDWCSNQMTPITQDVYVSPTGCDMNPGVNPELPFRTIRHALSAIAATISNPRVIHLAEGTYSPSQTGELLPLPLLSSLEVRGASRLTTILDGEFEFPLFIAIADLGARLTSLTCRGGDTENGGAIYSSYNPYLIIEDCKFINNSAVRGGVLYSEWESSTIVRNSSLEANTAAIGGGLYLEFNAVAIIESGSLCLNFASSQGGAIFGDNNCAVVAIETEITENSSNQEGSAIYLANQSSGEFSNCTITGNRTLMRGGIIHLAIKTSPTFTNCLIAENTSNLQGSIIFFSYLSDSLFGNCTITNNWGPKPAVLVSTDSSPVFINCILWNDSSLELIVNGWVSPNLQFCDIQDGFSGPGNLAANPLFCSGPNGDYYLQQILSGQSDNSPCLDKGSMPAAEICYKQVSTYRCLDALSTRTDNINDAETVDLGFHYPGLSVTPSPSIMPNTNQPLSARNRRYEPYLFSQE